MRFVNLRDYQCLMIPYSIGNQVSVGKKYFFQRLILQRISTARSNQISFCCIIDKKNIDNMHRKIYSKLVSHFLSLQNITNTFCI